jgi:hypothetical protein
VNKEYVWRIRSNLEIENMCKSPDIMTENEVGRLEWLCRVVRTEDNRLPKMVLNARAEEGRCGVGRPRLRWLDEAETEVL